MTSRTEVNPRQTLISWLNDAYAMENALIQTLERQANHAQQKPHVRRKIEEHARETRVHAERVKNCVERLGGSTSSVKTALGTMTGMIKGMSTAMAPDVLIKDGIADYSVEHMEIASYRALIAAARTLGEEEIVQTCEEILRDEVAMAEWLEQNLAPLVQEFLEQERQTATV